MNTLRDTFDLEAMKAELLRDEGLRLEVYKDPGSGLAVGVGRNLTTQGLSRDEAAALGIPDMAGPGKLTELNISRAFAFTMLVNDITDRAHQLDSYLPWWRLLSPVRQRVLLNMAFEMGTHGMIQKMDTGWGIITDIQRGLFDEAAYAMRLTPWGTGKTHNRAARLAEAMRHG